MKILNIFWYKRNIEFKNESMNGNGEMTIVDRTTYDGNFKDGLFEGKGINWISGTYGGFFNVFQ